MMTNDDVPKTNKDEERKEENYTLDTILTQIGEFGRFQILVFLLISIPMLYNAIFSVTYVFTAGAITYRCNITECDGPESVYDEPWLAFTTPRNNNLDQCKRYSSYSKENNTFSKEECREDNFDKNKIESCNSSNLIFSNEEVTISNEFQIYCSDEWKLSMVGTINNFGQLFGIPIGGYISDRYGRRIALASGGFFAAIFGTLRSYAPSYIFFITFEFLDNIASSSLYSICFIIGIELVGPRCRVLACCLITIFYAIGEVLLAIFAKYYQNWRLLLRVLYIPALSLIGYFWILPESVRWLLSQRREDEVKVIMKRAARINGHQLTDECLDKLISSNRYNLENCNESKFPFREALNQFFWRICNCSFCWIVNVLVYYGLSLNAVLLHGDKYNNFMFIALIEIPGFLLPLITMDRYGRRYTLFSCMFISGLCCLVTTFLSKDIYGAQLVLYLIGKMAITASFQVLYFFTSEIFPTKLRNTLLSFCSMAGRVGSMIAPQTPLLAKYSEHAPALLFAVAALSSACFSLLFPETTNITLPTTIKEANNIGTKNNNTSSTVTV